MTAGVDLERRLSSWFEDQAPIHAPDRVLAASLETVAVTRQRRSVGVRVGWRWAALSRRQRLILVLAATLGLLGGALVAGALLLQRDDPVGSASLLIVTPGAASPGDGGLTVRLRHPDGTTSPLATFDATFLGGQYADGAGISISPGGYLAIPVSQASGTSAYRIVDLRDPTLPPRVPDAEAMFGAWSPDDRFVITTNSGDLVVYDARTGASSIVTPVGGSPRDILFHPAWALDGSGLQANGGEGETLSAGTIGLDGTYVPGATAAFETGIGPRRTDAAGGRVQCVLFEDYGCEDGYTITVTDDTGSRDLYVDDDPDRRIADFSVAADGGLWLLLQTVAAGPRTVTLRHLAVDGTIVDYGTFDGVADDPDESSFFEAATFGGFSADDGRILVRLSGDQGSFGSTWLLEPATGERTQLDGSIAGWLAKDALTGSRPETVLQAEVPSDIRGAWVWAAPQDDAAPPGLRRLLLKRSTGTLDGVDALSARAEGADRLVLRYAHDQPGCAATIEGMYGWSIEDDRLTLDPIEDACDDRAARLGATFEPDMPVPDTGSAPVADGRTVLASLFEVPFRVTAPAGTDLIVTSHAATRVDVSRGEETPTVTIVPVTNGVLDPCDRHGSETSIPPGIDGVLEYLASRAEQGVIVEPAEDVVIDGLTGTSVTVDVAEGSACDTYLYPFHDGSYPTAVPRGSRITFIEPVPGRVVAVAVPPEALDDPDWTTALLDSIDFLVDAGS